MKSIITTLAAGVVLGFVGQANALTISGDVNMVFAPASVQLNDRTNNNKALLFTESANTVLASDLNVEAYIPGVYDGSSSPVGRTLAAGRTVNSYMLHADIDPSVSSKSMSGSITFNDKILGVIFGDFAASDALVGNAGTAYETANGHGMDLTLPNGDMFRISNNRMRIDFTINVHGIADQIRIITAGVAAPASDGGGENPIPEPVTPTLVAMGLGGLALRRRHIA